jgi:hypothetical protein
MGIFLDVQKNIYDHKVYIDRDTADIFDAILKERIATKFDKYRSQPWFDILRLHTTAQMRKDYRNAVQKPFENPPALINAEIERRYIEGKSPLIEIGSDAEKYITAYHHKLLENINEYLNDESKLINYFKNNLDTQAYINATFSNIKDISSISQLKLDILKQFIGIKNNSKLINHYSALIIFGAPDAAIEKLAKKNARIALEKAYVHLAKDHNYDRHAQYKRSQALKNFPHIQHPHEQLFQRLLSAELIKLNANVYDNNQKTIDDFLTPENITKLIQTADTSVEAILREAKQSRFSWIERLKTTIAGFRHDFNQQLKRVFNKAYAKSNYIYYKYLKFTTNDYDFYLGINNLRNECNGKVPKYADRLKPELAKLSKKSVLDDKTLYVISSLAYLDVVGQEMPEQLTEDFYEHIRYLSEKDERKWQIIFNEYITQYRSGLEISLHIDAKKPSANNAATINNTKAGNPEIYKAARIIIANAYLKLAEQGYDREEAFKIEQSLHQTWRFSFSKKPIQHGLSKEEKIKREFRNTRHTLRLYDSIQFLKKANEIASSRFRSISSGLELQYFFNQLTQEELKQLGISTLDAYKQKLKLSREITSNYDKYLLREHKANIKHLENIRKNREKSLTDIGQNAGLSAGIGTALNTLAIVTGGLLGMATLGWPFVGTMIAYAAAWAITDPIIDYIWPKIEKKSYFKNSLTGEFDLLASDKWKKTAKTGLMLFFSLIITAAALTILAAIAFTAWWVPLIAFAGFAIYASSKFMNINFFRKMTHAMILKFAKMDSFYRFQFYLGFADEFKLTNTQKYILMGSIIGNIIMGILYASLTYLRLNTFISDNINAFLKDYILGPDLYQKISEFKIESDEYPILADIGNFFINSSIGLVTLIPQLIVAVLAVCIFVGYAIVTTRPVAELIVFIKKAWNNPDEYFTFVKFEKTIYTFTNGIQNIWNKATEYEAEKTANKRNKWTILGALLTLTIAPIIIAGIYYILVSAYRYLNGSKIDQYNLSTFTGFFNFVADYAIRKPILHPLKALFNFIGGIMLGCLPFVSAAGAVALLSVSSESFAGILEEDVNLTAKEAENTSKIFLLFSIFVKTPLVVYSAFDAVAGLSSDKKENKHAEVLSKKIAELEDIFKNNMKITPENKNHTIKLRDFIKKYKDLSSNAAYAAKFNALESMFKIFVNAALQSELAIYDKDDPTAYLDYQTFRDCLFGGGAFAQSLSLGMMSRLGYEGTEAAELVKRIARAFRRTHIRLINDFCENNANEAENKKRRAEITKHFLNIDENGDAKFRDIPENIMLIILKERAEKNLRREAREQLEAYVSKMEESYIPSTRNKGHFLRKEFGALLNDSNYTIKAAACDDVYFATLANQYKNVGGTQKQAFLDEYKKDNYPAAPDRDTTIADNMNDNEVLTVLNEHRVKQTRRELHEHIDNKAKSKISIASEKGRSLKTPASAQDDRPQNDTVVDQHTGFWMLADYWNQFCEVDDQKISKPATTTRVLLNRYNNAREEYAANPQNCAVQRELKV